ncbi:acylneuraminate cytidylyltransferase family protein [Zobellella maritima]|uniref:acylneuraminate cytidylyltransferase family protein n=1 Tax=Zobellella maritima TaxID=2059725 RepID=UPI000E302293|nr:acylneuraminate cytidylyltransferase family protein [Zobellella maritima]
MKILAIIPARAGSKRLPNKNVKPLLGKPLIEWSIDAALGCQDITKVMVSTDSEQIGSIARSAGAEVPFVRPPELSTDTSSSGDVIKHAIDFYHQKDEVFDLVMLLQPTSPLRTQQHIQEAIQLFYEKSADAVISVCPVEHSPLWSNTIADDLSMDGFLRKELKNSRSQDLPQYYRLNGAIYLAKIDRFMAETGFFLSKNIYAYEMQTKVSVDIDEEVDFLLAETILKNKGF